MSYIFKGKLCGYICAECPEPLSDITVRLYRNQSNQNVTALAVANPKDTFDVLSDEAIRAKASSLIAEAKTDAEGRYSFTLNEKQYGGEAFEIDIYCGNVPHRKPSPTPLTPRQATLTTVQPMWRRMENGFVAGWDYCIPNRQWCHFRRLFGAWTICGKVTQCQTGAALSDIKVTAFDTDWLQDDDLGSAFTGADGKFRIDYLAIDFEQTPLSPFINFELFGGPDLYFKVEAADGTVLLQEPSSKGREAGRQNAGPCFCVDLCVDTDPTPPFNNPWFTHVGDFHILGDISGATGLTNSAVFAHGGPGYGFFGDLKLKGYCPKKSPIGAPDPMQYRFLYVHPLNPAVQVPITADKVFPVLVGSRLIQWDVTGSGLAWTFQSIYVEGSGATPDPTPTPVLPPGTPWGAPPPHVVVPDANGWVKVDQNSLNGGFYGPLIRFISDSAVPGGVAPNSGVGVAPAVQKLGVDLQIIFEAGPVGAAATFSNSLPKIHVNNWDEVSLLDLTEFHGGGNRCSQITTDLDIQYTADHELMAEWSVGISSAAAFPIPVLPGGNVPRGGAGTQHINVSTWPACSYTVSLDTRRKLTDGEVEDPTKPNSLTFCK